MIGKLKGKLDYLDSDHLIIDVGGVGYIVFCSHRTLRDMPEIGGDTTLIIETHVREDHIHLFGFIDSLERDCFRQLIKVKGVGSKLALAILGVLTPNALSTALNSQDKTAFVQIAGVGPKLADRILSELKGSNIVSLPGIAIPPTTTTTIISDAVSALTNLGFNRERAYSAALNLTAQQGDITLGELIKLLLKELK